MLTIEFTETIPATGRMRHFSPLRVKVPRYPDGRIRYQELLRSIKIALPTGSDRQRPFPQPATSVEAAWNYLHPTSTVGSLLTLQDPASTDQARDKACARLEWIIDRRFLDERHIEALERIPRSILRELLRELRLDALLLAAGGPARPRTIRLGRQWVTNKSGNKVRIRPTALTLPDYCHYLIQRAKRIYGNLILEEGFDQQESPIDDKLESIVDPKGSPLLDALIAEDAQIAKKEVDLLLLRLSGTPKKFVRELLSQFKNSPHLKFSEAITKAAKKLKISPSYKCVLLKRIRPAK